MTHRSPLASHEGDTLTLSELRVGPDLNKQLPARQSASSILFHVLRLKSTAERIAFAHSLTEQPEVLGYAVDEARRPALDWTYHALKRTLDILLATAMLLILLPIFVAISLAIMLETGAPILYYQNRVGLNGRVFRFYKFRSMVRNAGILVNSVPGQDGKSGLVIKTKDDPRVTKVGKFLRRTSLDELPQLFNVFRGDISVIGPRPLVEAEANLCDEHQYQRHAVAPGLLCLREICGRSALSWEERMELDLLYVKSQSTRADLAILLAAIPAILKAEHAY